jgi:hypothetical protein
MSDSEFKGIKIYWSQTNDIATMTNNNSIDMGKAASVSISAIGLSPGIQYCYAATVYDIYGSESDFSNVVCKTDPTGRISIKKQ